MNLKTMQESASGLYAWANEKYPNRRIVVMGHSYGSGMAAYVAGAYDCDALVLAAAYRDLSDLYNKIIPIFWGPLKVFISNNMVVSQYAESINVPVLIIGSSADTTLNEGLQKKVAECFSNSTLKIFENISHENYYNDDEVIGYIKYWINNLYIK